ncbi:MAG: DUF3761 domain-containing protein [Pseudonocardiaceae bacterium]
MSGLEPRGGATSSSAAVPATAGICVPVSRQSLPPSAGSAQQSSCETDYYRNSDGKCIHRPQQAAAAPAGATTRCSDGEYSFSRHRQGTYSGHDGVAQWL